MGQIEDAVEIPLQYRTVHGHRRAFRMAGNGPETLLLIHGIGDSSTTWTPVLSQLARRYRVIAPDLLGHGASDKPRADYAVAAYANGMRDLLSILDVDRVTVIGHSMGAGVGMQFAYQFPERCDRLVLVGSGGVSTSVHPMLRLAAIPGVELLMPLVLSPPAQRAARSLGPVLRHVLGLGSDVEHIWSKMSALADKQSRQAFLRTLRGVVDPRGQVVTMLDRCYLTEGVPVLIIWGAHDAIVPIGHALTAHEAMTGSRLEVFEHAGHFPHIGEPARFVGLIEEFVGSTRGQTYDVEMWRALLRGDPPPDLRETATVAAN
jgi:pimeloyl-ACP methyl ester carboxylesterase